MNLSGMGRVTEFAKFKMEKVKDLKDHADNILLKHFSYEQSEEGKKARISGQVQGILWNFKNGAEPSFSDMAFLREHAPEMYHQMKRTLDDRVAYRKELERCKTKEDVRRLIASRPGRGLESISSASGAAVAPDAAMARVENLRDQTAILHTEGSRFLRTTRYNRLPRNEKEKRILERRA